MTLSMILAVSLALLVAAVAPTATATCAPKCVCAHTIMICSNKGLTELPQGTWPNVVFLDLSGNAISNVDALGERFPRLAVLRMRDNALTTLHLSALAGPQAPQGLKGADLSANAVTHVVFPQPRAALPNVFSTLLLTGNRIASLHPDTFRALPNLKKLALNDNPLVLGPEPFLSHALLTELDVSGANASAVSALTFAQLPSLNLLGLQGSGLQDVRGLFTTLQVLESLYLESNQITRIEAASFPSSNSLKHLSLDRNPLIRIDPEALAVQDGGELAIEDTPLSCACAYSDVALWAEEHRVELFADCNGASSCQLNHKRRKSMNGDRKLSFNYSL